LQALSYPTANTERFDLNVPEQLANVPVDVRDSNALKLDRTPRNLVPEQLLVLIGT
jgi:hypothetical protein